MRRRTQFGIVMRAGASSLDCAVPLGDPMEQTASFSIDSTGVAGAAGRAAEWVTGFTSRRDALLILEAPWCQVRALRNLPELRKQADLLALLRENAATFFLRQGFPLLIPAPRRLEDGTAVGCAFSEAMVLGVRDAMAVEGVALRAVAAADVVRSATAGQALPQINASGPLVYWLEDRRPERRLKTFSVAVALIAITFFFAAPAAAAYRATEEFSTELRKETNSYGFMPDSVRAEIASQTTAIRHLFKDHRSTTLLLGRLAAALPPDAHVEAFRSDSATTSVTVTTTDLDALLAKLEHRERGAVVDLAGQVSRVAGTEGRQRATVVIRWPSNAVPTQ